MSNYVLSVELSESGVVDDLRYDLVLKCRTSNNNQMCFITDSSRSFKPDLIADKALIAVERILKEHKFGFRGVYEQIDNCVGRATWVKGEVLVHPSSLGFDLSHFTIPK